MLVIAGIRISGSAQFAVMTKKAERAEYTVCIDSGHGGNDPGKIGVAGTKEKEVNLTIALKLKKHLERQNIRVIMTRTDDRNLADANATNEKIADMKQRVAKMNSEQPDAVISIHQNSYTDSSVIIRLQKCNRDHHSWQCQSFQCDSAKHEAIEDSDLR